MTRARELGIVALIVVAYAVSLGRTTSYGYVWDDVPEIEHGQAFDAPLADGLLLTQVERSDPNLVTPMLELPAYDVSYRPVVFASEWLDVRMFGRDAGALHRTSVVLGGIAIALAYLAARRWLRSAWALVPTALFALHPAQIEAVAYLSGRADLLAGLFAVATLYLAFRVADARSRRAALAWLVATAICYALLLLSKECGIGLPVAAVAALWRRGERNRRVWTLATLAAVTAGFLVFRAVVPTPPHASPLYAATLVGAASAVVDYLRVIALPFDLSIARPASDQPVLGWVAAAAVVAVVVGARRRLGGELVGGVVWALALLGTSLFAVASTHLIADRYLYAPMFGVGIALAQAGRAAVAAVAARRVLRWPVRVAAVVWAVMLVAVGWRQVPFWQDRRALYEHAAELAPDSSPTQYRVARLDIEDDRWDLAVPRLEHAIELDPRNAEALNNLGVYHLRAGDLVLAEALLARAVDANPSHFRSFLNLGLTRIALGKHADGCKDVARAMELMTTYEAARAVYAEKCR